MASKKLEAARKLVKARKKGFLLCLDPSVSKTGVALFSLEEKKIIWSRTISGSSTTIVAEIFSILKAVSNNRKESKIVCIENPTYYGGRGEAAHSSGRIGVLYRIAGIFYGLGIATQWECIELTPLEWKGNLPKAITTKKINRIYGLELNPTGTDSDEADAIAIGSRILGEW